MSLPIRYTLPQRPATVAAIGIAAYYFGRQNRDLANLFGGRANFDKWAGIIFNIHAAEALAMLVYTLYRGADLVTAGQWTLTQFVVGFPAWFHFKRLNNV
ncbi:uncharacterized protein UBRO_08048 [Ustilago bromivora]|uniref:Uncharacterized protein n=1 Tax=Ustilago bromivora TaxID=307758 RepID=A0A1K0FWD5_9BASI|nr:uncharacterized protein UBRO_08048 [Ustilago bromivora]